MALTNDEVLRCKLACGYNVVGVGAEAYGLDGFVALFDRAIQPYLSDPTTTCTTPVTAAPAGATVQLTLASNPPVVGNTVQPLAIAQGSSIVVDVGPAQESSVVQVLSGLTLWCQLSNAHGVNGAYPVRPKGAEQPIRDLLTRLDTIDAQLSSTAIVAAGTKQVDEVSLYASESMGRRGRTLDRFDSLISQRLQARRDLCLALGLPYLPDLRRGRST
ncbi:MAG: hypothetical protein M3O36_01045, partial [Myxococcota bacterium]|nr:hypothetical protein [Myxococcota bacterium]